MAKRRNLTDPEISVVKAMLRKGWRNDAIHCYFNKPDRLISSGRITQIKKGKYGASVEEAPPEELEAFLATWQDPKTKASPAPSPVEAKQSAIVNRLAHPIVRPLVAIPTAVTG